MEKNKMAEWLSEGSVAIPKLLMNHYAELGLNEQEFMMILHIHVAIEGGNDFLTPEEMSKKMSISAAKCMEVLRKLLKEGFIGIEQKHDPSSMIAEFYTLQPLWYKLVSLLFDESKKHKQIEQEEEEGNLYTMFEKEFGRPLSPFECETLAMWQDQDYHDVVIIKAALREAVMSGKLNFRYIDRILFEWKKNGVKTIEQARNHGQRFRQHQQTKKQAVSQPQRSNAIPFFNWLEQ
ncbi:DnaD domain-containing protein [Priestia koreensis]|uniref:DnaD domain-containing protein n=1 Tax=Priestia koreensis TaxID=284581 RepID=UPI00204084AF|nr:DnaD domain-containing protein [Priestia koreensis]MCM3003223.1 DnaD domain-containing protein [Priestia koreensis]